MPLPAARNSGENLPGKHVDDAPSLDRYTGPPPIVLVGSEGRPRMAPFPLSRDGLIDLRWLREAGPRFPEKTVERYRQSGLRSVRIGRRVWFRLVGVLRFLDQQQDRLRRT